MDKRDFSYSAMCWCKPYVYKQVNLTLNTHSAIISEFVFNKSTDISSSIVK